MQQKTTNPLKSLSFLMIILTTIVMLVFLVLMVSSGKPGQDYWKKLFFPWKNSSTETPVNQPGSTQVTSNPDDPNAPHIPEKDKPIFGVNGILGYKQVPMTALEEKLVTGARTRLGDIYDTDYYGEGHPPEGRSACTDVAYYSYLTIGIDLQREVNEDSRANPSLYPNLGDSAINHRRCPNLIVWFKRYTKSLTLQTDKAHLKEWRPGDVIFWSLQNDGVADHVGIISNVTLHDGTPLVIHQFPPKCVENDVMRCATIVGHFRYVRR